MPYCWKLEAKSHFLCYKLCLCKYPALAYLDTLAEVLTMAQGKFFLNNTHYQWSYSWGLHLCRR